jgi:phage baseplate assembly protein gpV
MLGPVIPSFYDTRDVGELPRWDGGAFSNFLLRPGEVKRLIYPDDPSSRSRRFIEYDVYVQHRENDTAVSKLYHNCFLVNPLAGFADKAVWTLRADNRQNVKEYATPGLGSKVTVMCLNGEHAQALIVGGIRDSKDTDVARKAKGHHAEFEFNGVNLSCNDDGSWTLVNKGKTAADGTADEKRDKDGAGTTVKVEANGNFEVSTAKGQRFLIDHKAGTIRIEADKTFTVVADRINHGNNADEHAVLGDQLKKVLETMIDLIMKPDSYLTAVGPTLVNLHAVEWLKLRVELEKILSHQSFLKRSAR